MSEVRDLDVVLGERRIVKLGGNEIDVSFLPTGMTFVIDDVISEIAKIDAKKIGAGDKKESRKAFELNVALCAAFCSWKHPEMTVEWFNENTTASQVATLGVEIRDALTRAYNGLDEKN